MDHGWGVSIFCKCVGSGGGFWRGGGSVYIYIYMTIYIYIYIYIYAHIYVQPPPPYGPWFYCLLGMVNLESRDLKSGASNCGSPKPQNLEPGALRNVPI